MVDTTVPYCRGCGHRYFGRPEVPLAEAAVELCQWCVQEAQTGVRTEYLTPKVEDD